MSEFENVIPGKLRLKGKALDVKAGGIMKKKKHKKHYQHFFTENNSSGLLFL